MSEPTLPSLPEPRQNDPFDPVMSDMLRQNLFYYFQQRGFFMTKSLFEVGPPVPQVIDMTWPEKFSMNMRLSKRFRRLAQTMFESS